MGAGSGGAHAGAVKLSADSQQMPGDPAMKKPVEPEVCRTTGVAG
jgi:hypothetical protein